jgi:hypothetical protein
VNAWDDVPWGVCSPEPQELADWIGTLDDEGRLQLAKRIIWLAENSSRCLMDQHIVRLGALENALLERRI